MGGSGGFRFRAPTRIGCAAEFAPLARATTPRGARGLAKTARATRQYGPMEAIRTGQLPLMWFSLAIIGGVSLFGIGYMVDFAKEVGFGPLIAASSAGVLSIVNGVGRGVVGWTSDQIGRKQTLVI